MGMSYKLKIFPNKKPLRGAFGKGGRKSEISKFYTDLKEVTNCDL
jgi:hypothetical protein